MPFMIGPSPIRRTLQYLKAGRIVLKDRIKVFTVHYNAEGDHHKGAREFVFWCIPQLQYKNPDVQVITMKNVTPSPFIRVFLDDGSDVVIDIEGKENDEIQKHLLQTVCKTQEQLKKESKALVQQINPANFGFGCRLNCICRIEGQIPCPAIVKLPNHMRGKFLYFDRD